MVTIVICYLTYKINQKTSRSDIKYIASVRPEVNAALITVVIQTSAQFLTTQAAAFDSVNT